MTRGSGLLLATAPLAAGIIIASRSITVAQVLDRNTPQIGARLSVARLVDEHPVKSNDNVTEGELPVK